MELDDPTVLSEQTGLESLLKSTCIVEAPGSQVAEYTCLVRVIDNADGEVKHCSKYKALANEKASVIRDRVLAKVLQNIPNYACVAWQRFDNEFKDNVDVEDDELVENRQKYILQMAPAQPGNGSGIGMKMAEANSRAAAVVVRAQASEAPTDGGQGSNSQRVMELDLSRVKDEEVLKRQALDSGVQLWDLYDARVDESILLREEVRAAMKGAGAKGHRGGTAGLYPLLSSLGTNDLKREQPSTVFRLYDTALRMNMRFDELGIDFEQRISVLSSTSSPGFYENFLLRLVEGPCGEDKEHVLTLVCTYTTQELAKFTESSHQLQSAIRYNSHSYMARSPPLSPPSLSRKASSRLRVIVHGAMSGEGGHSKEPLSMGFEEGCRLLMDLHATQCYGGGKQGSKWQPTGSNVITPRVVALEMVSLASLIAHFCDGNGYSEESGPRCATFQPLAGYAQSALPLGEQLLEAIFSVHHSRAKIERFLRTSTAYPQCFEPELLVKLQGWCAKFDSHGCRILAEAELLVVEMRDSTSRIGIDLSTLKCYSEQLSRLQHEVEELSDDAERFLNSVAAPYIKRLRFARLVKEWGGLYFGHHGDGPRADGGWELHAQWEEVLTSQHGVPSVTYVLVCDPARQVDSDMDAVNSVNFFIEVLLKGLGAAGGTGFPSKAYRCVVLDSGLANMEASPWRETSVDQAPSPTNAPTAKVMKLLGDRVQSSDYLAEYRRKRITCMAKVGNAHRDEGIPADDTAPLEIACPKSTGIEGLCSSEDRFWECDDCGQVLQFQPTTRHFFCACGWSEPKEMTFRCADISTHGEEFVHFSEEKLQAIISELTSFGEKNVLILGKTGIGKSTLVNAMGLYLTYEQLGDALAADDPPCLIPARFTMADEDYRETPITIGTERDDACNERLSEEDKGRSSTIAPKAHVLNCKSGQLRLVDTGGFCDVDGPEQDKMNFNATLQYIANIKQLNAICFLLKPNESKLTVEFKYCLSELLTHLHKDAAKNIVFVFTNAKETFYRPGETLIPLRKYLDEVEQRQGVRIRLDKENIFCFDNEAFRFLWAVRGGVRFSDQDHQTYAESWRKSQEETNRFIKYLLSLSPHRTSETVSLNEARRIICTLAKPLATATQTIQANQTAIADQQLCLQTVNTSEADFESQLRIPKVTVKATPLGFPRTVCTAHCHTDVVQGQVVYKTHCHVQCGLRDVIPDKTHSEALRGCWAMDGTNCRNCKCSYRDHMHITYSQEAVTEYVKSAEVAKKLAECGDKKATINVLINTLKQRSANFDAEKERIISIAAQCVVFLRQHSIMVDYDAIANYIELCIREEERKAATTQDYRRVEGLRDCLDNYREQNNLFEQAVAAGTKKAPDATAVKLFYKELIMLPLTGPIIKQLFDLEEKGQLNHPHYRRMTGKAVPAALSFDYTRFTGGYDEHRHSGSRSPSRYQSSNGRDSDWVVFEAQHTQRSDRYDRTSNFSTGFPTKHKGGWQEQRKRESYTHAPTESRYAQASSSFRGYGSGYRQPTSTWAEHHSSKGSNKSRNGKGNKSAWKWW